MRYTRYRRLKVRTCFRAEISTSAGPPAAFCFHIQKIPNICGAGLKKSVCGYYRNVPAQSNVTCSNPKQQLPLELFRSISWGGRVSHAANECAFITFPATSKPQSDIVLALHNTTRPLAWWAQFSRAGGCLVGCCFWWAGGCVVSQLSSDGSDCCSVPLTLQDFVEMLVTQLAHVLYRPLTAFGGHRTNSLIQS